MLLFILFLLPVKGYSSKNSRHTLGISPGAISSNQVFCYSGDPTLFADSISATTSCTNITYQWQSSPDGSFWTDILGAVSSTYDAPILNTTNFYRRIATDDCSNTDFSNIVTVTIANPPVPSVMGDVRCGTGSLSLSASGSSFSYNWYDLATGGSVLYTGAIFTTPAISSSFSYFVASIDANGCESLPRIPVSAVIKTNPSVQFNSSTQSGCPSATLHAIGGAANPSVFLDGTDDYVQLPDFGFHADFTVGAWVYMRSYNNNSRLLDMGNGPASDNIILTLSSGTTGLPAFTIYNGATPVTRISSFRTVPLNQWAHVAYVLAGNTGSIYVNGQFAGSATFNVPNNIARTNNYLGRSNFPADGYTNANIDELHIWNQAFSEAQINTGMYLSLPGTIPGLQAIWKMDEGAGTIITDAKAGLTGTLINGATWSNTSAPYGLTYSWSPSATLSSSTGMTVTASPSSSLMYTVIVQDTNGCTASANVTVNPGTPGDTSVYGNGQWNVYGFNSLNWTNYYGYFTSASLNVDSRNDFQRQSSPSYAIGFQGCEIPVDNHSVSYKRTNIPTQTYRIDVGINDDDCVLNIDGKQKFARSASATSAIAWIGNLTPSSKVEFKWFDVTTASQALFTFTSMVAPSLSGGTITGDQEFCNSGDPIAFTSSSSASGCFISGYQWQSSVDSITWSDIPGATSIVYDAGVLTDTTYFRRKANDDCGATAYSNAITVLVVSTPAPIGTGGSHCDVGSITLSASGSPSSYNWYDVSSGGSSLGTTSSFITPVISLTTLYYVASVSVEGCESIRIPVTANVNTLPSAPSVTNGSRCGNGTVTLSASGSSFSYNWYDVSVGGVPLGSASVYVTPSISSTTTYYVTTVNSNGCESAPRTGVTATINPLPSAPVGVNASNCGSGTVNLSANGSPSGYNWYAAPSGGSPLAGTQNFTTPVITSTTVYYVSSVSLAGCESSTRTGVTATINAIPSSPTGIDSAKCGMGSVLLFVNGSPSTYNWYDVPIGGVSFNTTSSYTTPVLSATAIYYVSSVSLAGCESATRISVTATINSIPLPPTSADIARCGPGSVLLTASGSPSTYNWYDVPSGGVSLATTSTFTTPSKSVTTPFYVSMLSVVGCESGRTLANAIINPIPAMPSVTNGSNCGTGTVNLSASGSPSTYNWYAASSGGTALAVTPGFTTPVISVTTNYFVTSVSAAGCESAPRVSVTATIRPVSVGGTVGTAASVCSGSNGSSIFLGGQTGNVIRWESSLDNFVTAGTTIVNTTSSLNYLNLTQTTSYRAVVQTVGCPSANSVPVTITVSPLPVAPSGVNGVKCGPGVVLLSASGSPATYNWYNVSSGGIPSDNDSLFATPGIGVTTIYYVTSVNAAGCESATRTAITATIIPLTVGGTLSPSTSVCANSNGGSINLSGFTGSIIGWEFSLDNFATAGTPISNTTSNLTYSNLTQTTSYRVIVQSGSCAVANSSVATITVFPVSVGGTLSSSASVCSGSNGATINLAGHTGSITGWESSLDNFATAGTPIVNTTSSLTYSNLTQTTFYRAIVKSGVCALVNSSVATITVSPVSVGGTLSSSANVCSGSNGAAINLAGHTGSITGWESSLDNFATAGTPIVNTTSSLTYLNLTQTTSYRAIVQSGVCASANSSIVTITVSPVSVGGTLSSSATVCSGSNGATINLTGQIGSITGWESSLDNFATTGTPISNTTSNLIYSNLTQNTSYRVIVQSGVCAAANSLVVTISVSPVSIGGTLSSSAIECSGSNGATINLAGYTGSITGWESSLDNFTTAGIPIVNTTSSLAYSNLTQTTSYRAIVESGACATANSSIVTIAVSPVTVGGALSCSSMTVCSGLNGATINLSGETGAVTGWEFSFDNFATAGTPISNITTSLTYTNLTQTTSYRATVQSGACAIENSSVVTITVSPVSIGGTLSSSAIECSGLNGATINLSGETGAVIGWESSFDNFTTAGTPIINTTSSLTYSNLNQTTSYRAIIQSGVCAAVNSPVVTITVSPVTVGGNLSCSSLTACSGLNGATINLSGETGAVLGWESSADNFATVGTPVSNTTANLSYSNLTQTTSYRAIVQSPGCLVENSSVVTITIDPLTVGGVLSSSAIECSGANNSIINLTGYTGSITSWESSLDNFTTAGTPIINTTSSLVYSNLTQTTSYRVVVQSGVCAAANSSVVTITVSPVSVGGTVSSSATECSGLNGSTINLSGETGVVLGWEFSLDSFATAGTLVTNTTTSLSYSNLMQTTSYRAIVQSPGCLVENSSIVTITVDPLTVGGILSSSATECSGSNGSTVSLTGYTGVIIGWESSLDNFATAGTAITNTTPDLIYSNLTQTTSFRAIVQSGVCAAANSSIVTISVSPVSVGGTLSSSAAECSGSNNATINLTGYTGAITTWESSLDSFATAGTPIANSTSGLTYTNLMQTTYYRAIVQSGVCPSENSSVVTIVVTPSTVGGILSSSATECSGSNGSTISLTGYTGAVTGWESSLDNFATAGTVIANTTTDLIYSNLTQTTSYRVIVQSGVCAAANSSVVTISVSPVSVGGTLSSSAAECSGSNGATINLTGYTGAITGWESSLDSFATAGTPVANTTSALDYSNLVQTIYYRAIVQSGVCAAANSSVVTIAVSPSTVGGVLNSSAIECSGSNNATINLAGYTGAITGWESSLDSFATAGIPIANTTSGLTYTNLVQTTYYRAIVQSGVCPMAYSPVATIVVSPVTVGGTLSSSATECSGSNNAIINLGGYIGNIIGWESSLDNFATTGTAVANNAPNLTYTNLTQSTSYRVIVQSPGCSVINSSVVTITIVPSSLGGTLSSSAMECSGTNNATINLSGYTGNIIGWESSLDNFATTGTPIANTNPVFSYSNLTQTTYYKVIVQNGICPLASSSIVAISVSPQSIGGALSGATTVCSGSNGATINLSGSVGAVTGWESSLDDFATAGTAISNISPGLTYGNLTQTTSYRAIVQSGVCAAVNSSPVTITVSTDPGVYPGVLQGTDTTYRNEDGGTLTLSGSTSPVLSWESSLDSFVTAGTPISNTTTSLTYANLSQTTSYRAVVQGIFCPAQYSNIVTITVVDRDYNLTIYQSLSPNGDNLNDEWTIVNIENFPKNKVSICDRWGNLVFKEEGYNNTDKVWKGNANAGITLGNKELPDGTYFYVLDLGDGSAARRGFIVINK